MLWKKCNKKSWQEDEACPLVKQGRRKRMYIERLSPAKAFFFYEDFLQKRWRFAGQQGMGGGHLLFHYTTSTRSRTLRHLYATFHVRWLSRIFNRNACVYQTATRWDLPLYWITFEWLIDDAMLVCLFLLDELILGFSYSDLNSGFELASTITFVLQANGLTKCASHPKSFNHLIPSLDQKRLVSRFFKVLHIWSTFTNITIPFMKSIS